MSDAPIPGPRSRELAQRLRATESRNVTFVDERFPIFWETASGAIVTDVDGNRYIDLTAGFGVANAGHANPAVAATVAMQAVRLMHAMGDVHPARVKVELLEKLAAIAPGNLAKTFLASTGSEAIEAAMKTAVVAAGKPAFAAHRGAYHGLSIGALALCGIEKFRDPFAPLLPPNTLLLDYPRDDCARALDAARAALRSRDDLAALFVEPIQARGGNLVPPPGYLRGLREICSERGVLLVFDEIYTGFGRTGTMFACEHEGVVPDLLCIGKGLGNGFPISATLADPAIMDAWPESPGEALHTSTFLGNPMACAAALATIREIERLDLPRRARDLGALLGARLESLRAEGKARDARGRGLLWGLELRDATQAAEVVKSALRKGVILVQAGPQGNVLSFSPPLVISQEELMRALDIVAELL